jgi:hypothetical protein
VEILGGLADRSGAGDVANQDKGLQVPQGKNLSVDRCVPCSITLKTWQ